MKKILFLLLLISPIIGFAQTLKSFRNTVSDGYNFWLYTPPGYDSTVNDKPIVLFLHGASLCGNDLNQVRRYGTINALERGRKVDAVVIAPQNPGGSWQPDKLMNVVKWVEEHYAGDTNRFYVLGMSMGGYGTFNFTAAYPDKVAAAMALCGGAHLSSYCSLTKVPLWIMHGTADKAVSCSESQKIVNGMIACGDTSRLIFTKLSGMNHSQLAQIFYLDETYDWLFKHALTDSARTVNRDYVINREVMGKAYQNLTRENIPILNGATGKVVTSTNSSAPSQSSASKKYHTVKKGDTLSQIARKYHTTVAKLCKLNHIKETTILSIGRKLRVR